MFYCSHFHADGSTLPSADTASIMHITNRRNAGQKQATQSFHLVLRLSRTGLLFSLYFYRASTSILVKVPFSLTYIPPKLLKPWLEKTIYCCILIKKRELKHVNFSDTVWTERHFIEIEEWVCASITKEKPHETQNISSYLFQYNNTN